MRDARCVTRINVFVDAVMQIVAYRCLAAPVDVIKAPIIGHFRSLRDVRKRSLISEQGDKGCLFMYVSVAADRRSLTSLRDR